MAKTVVLLHEEYFWGACLRTPKILDEFGFEGSIFSLITELTLAALIIYYYQVKKRQPIRNENI